MPPLKTCKLCGESKPLSDYNRHPHTRDNRDQRCRPCAGVYARARLESHPHAQWESRYRARAHQLGVIPVIVSFTRAEMIAYWGNGDRCIYCDGPFEELEHLTPVGLGGHHVVQNVAPCCAPCNRVNTQSVRRARALLRDAA